VVFWLVSLGAILPTFLDRFFAERKPMPSSSKVAVGVERRISSRRTESERRSSGRTDPAPRRAQLRRKTDVVDYLGAPRGRGSESGSEPVYLRRVRRRPLKTWIERGLGKESGKLFS
jgi:hypothetical protein